MRSKDLDLMKDIVDYIDNRYENSKKVPSNRDIARHFNKTHTCINNYIQDMVERDMLSIKDGSVMTKKMELQDSNFTLIPIIGTISCGHTKYAEQTYNGFFPVPKGFLGSGKHYALQANGNSMINAGINDGDLVFFREQPSAEEGQIVVALVDNEATLKRFYRDKKKKKIRLHPENEDYEDMYFDNVTIQGVVTKIFKDLF